MPDYAKTLSKMLPPSLGSLFGQPLEEPARPAKMPLHPRDLPGALSAPELCCIVDQYKPDLLARDAIAEVKIDGLRCLYIAGRLWTREGSPFEAAEHCLPTLRDLEALYGVPMMFDGEYVEDGGLESTLSAFRSRKGNGCLWLFDAVPFAEWQGGRPGRQTLALRKIRLCTALRAIGTFRGGPVGYLESVQVRSAGDVEEKARNCWRAGFEGIVVKDAASLYCRKRTSDWMKVKLRTLSTMVVVDVLGCKRRVEVVVDDARTIEERECAKTLLVRLPGLDVSGKGKRPLPPIRLNVPPGGLSETLWQHRGDLMNGGTVDVEHAGFTGGGQPREAVLKGVNL